MSRKSVITSLLLLTFGMCWAQESSPPPAEKHAPAPSSTQEQSTQPQEKPKPAAIVLTEGTEVKLQFAQSVTSRVARPGQVIEFAVAEDVVVDGVTIIKKGARSIGYVEDSAGSGSLGKGGSMEIRLEAIRTRGRMVKITGTRSRTEKRATGKVVAMTIFFGLSGFLAASGHEAKIPEGTPITGFVAETVEFPAETK